MQSEYNDFASLSKIALAKDVLSNLLKNLS